MKSQQPSPTPVLLLHHQLNLRPEELQQGMYMCMLVLLPPRLLRESWELAVEVLGISCQLYRAVVSQRFPFHLSWNLRAQPPSLPFAMEDPEVPCGLQLPPLVMGSVKQGPCCSSTEVSLARQRGSPRVTRHLKGKGLVVVEGEYEVHLATLAEQGRTAAVHEAASVN